MSSPVVTVAAYMEKAERALDEARLLSREKKTEGACNRAYYAMHDAAHAALLAWKSGKPVKLIYDRAEDMVATTKRHPSRTRHRTAVSADGKILGGEIEFTIDGGAYATLSSVVLSRGTIHAGGPYYWPSVRIRSRCTGPMAVTTAISGAHQDVSSRISPGT